MERVADYLSDRLYDKGIFDDYKAEKTQLYDIFVETIETGKSNFAIVIDRTRSHVSVSKMILTRP